MTARLLSTEEVADRFRTSPATVRYWRHIEIGPAGVRVGRRVLYDQAECDRWWETKAAGSSPRAADDLSGANGRGIGRGALSPLRGRLISPAKTEQPRRVMASIARRPDGTWRPRYRDAEGKEHARHFTKKADAQRWLDEVTPSVVTGMYLDPTAGRVPLSAFYAAWAARQVWAPGTQLAIGLAVRSATFKDVELRLLRRSHVESWVKQMTAAGLAPGTVHTRVQNVRAVLRGAVRDPGDRRRPQRRGDTPPPTPS